MSSDEKRKALLHEIEAWREAADAYGKGSPQNRKFQRKMKEVEGELHGLGPSQESPSLAIKIVDPEEPQEQGAGPKPRALFFHRLASRCLFGYR